MSPRARYLATTCPAALRRTRRAEEGGGGCAYRRARRRMQWRHNGDAPRPAPVWAARHRDHAREPRELLRPHAAPVRILLGTAGTAALLTTSADRRTIRAPPG